MQNNIQQGELLQYELLYHVCTQDFKGFSVRIG